MILQRRSAAILRAALFQRRAHVAQVLGLVPQQPPMILAPAIARQHRVAAISSGVPS
jgi:hypothetical protein